MLVTGAAGNIGYSIIPLICNGTFLGSKQPIILHLLDIPPCADKLNGVKLEVDDCAFPLVKGMWVIGGRNRSNMFFEMARF